MGELVTVKLDTILVDPRMSPRVRAVSRRYLETVTEAVREGAELPPLLVAKPADFTAPWCACQKPDHAPSRAVWNAETDRVAYASRPVLPEYVLVDGLTRFWALREAGQRTATCEVWPEPVRSAADVRSLAIAPNSRHGRRLEDADLRTAVVELYLGRPVTERESWIPAAGGLAQELIGQRLGRSQSWVSKVVRWHEFMWRCHLTDDQDPGLERCSLVVKLDPRLWRDLVWAGPDTPAVWGELDADLKPARLSAGWPLWELPMEQFRRWMQVWEAQAAAAGTSGAAPTPAAGGQQRLPFGDWYEGDLPAVPSGAREVARALYAFADKLSPERWEQVVSDYRPLYIDVAQTWEKLRTHGRRLGKEV